MDSKQDG